MSAIAILPHIWTPFSPFIFPFLSPVPWQGSSLFLVLQLLPHSTWTAEPSHKIRIINNVHHLLWCICFPLPHNWGGTSTDSRTNPTLSQRSGTAAYPGHLFKHCSLLFHVQGSSDRQLAVQDPVPLEKKGCAGARGTGMPSKAKGGAVLPCLVLLRTVTPHTTHANSQFQLRWPRHRREKVRRFLTWAAFSNITCWNQWPVRSKLAPPFLFV